jgi:hypothetical protein
VTNFIRKLLGLGPKGDASSQHIDDELREEVHDVVRMLLTTGFVQTDQIRPTAASMLAGVADDATIAQLVDVSFSRASRAHLESMKSWPAVTDCDRLDTAFDELDNLGIMVRHDWTCCSNCAVAALHQALENTPSNASNVPFIGYVYYHQQDSQRAADGGGLLLGYGTLQPTEDQTNYQRLSVQVARQACDVLKKHNLQINWDGTIERRLEVQLNWQRRHAPTRHWNPSVVGEHSQ